MSKQSERAERKLERQKAKREWKLIKPRPLNDLIKNSADLIKWLLLAGGLFYLATKSGFLLELFKK